MKQTLLLIPGLLCDRDLWTHQAAALSPFADCIVTEAHMHHATIGEIAAAAVAGLPQRFAVAGLSMGGYTALEICRRFGARVERLALLDTSARADTAEQTARRETLIDLCRSGGFADVIEQLYTVLVHPGRRDDGVLKRRIAAMARRTGPEVFIRQQHAIMARPDQVASLSRLSCPTVVICGAQDRITPLECSEEMAAGISGAKLKTIPACGHMSTMEAPATVASILTAWLTAPSARWLPPVGVVEGARGR